VKANGHELLQGALNPSSSWKDQPESLALRQGLNTIVYEMVNNLRTDIVLVDYIQKLLPIAAFKGGNKRRMNAMENLAYLLPTVFLVQWTSIFQNY